MAMTLAQAFRECGPLTGTPTIDVLREEAWGIVYCHVMSLCGRLSSVPRELVEDAASAAVMLFAQNGPRGAREADPTSDEGVAAFLFVVLRNAVRDALRKQARVSAHESSLDETLQQVAGDGAIETPWAGWVGHAVGEAQRRLSDEVVPWVSGRLRADAREGFCQALDQIVVLSAGGGSIDDMVHVSGEEPTTRNLNVLYQRHSRARRRLMAGIDAFIVERRLPPAEAEALRAVAEDRYRRQ